MIMLNYMIATVALVLIDQITKLIALVKLRPIGNITILKGFMDFTYVENRGAAFGMLQGKQWLFIIITIVVAIGVIVAFKKMPVNKEYNLVRLACVLILGGAFGNLIDRIVRGYVVDFFEFTFISYPVFNVADIYVVIGAIWLAWIMIFVIKDDAPKKLELEAEESKDIEEIDNKA